MKIKEEITDWYPKLYQEGGSLPEDKILSNIYSKYPALKNMGPVKLKADSTFTTDKTEAGSIEFFDPSKLQNNTITYNTGYQVKNPSDTGFGIVYNPKTNDEQDITLDMLHGMPKDKIYAKHREEFSKAFLNAHGGDFKRDWENERRGNGI